MDDLYRIVESDNWGRDYPDEKFATPHKLSKRQADRLAKAFNDTFNPHGEGSRYWKVVPDGYELQPGFEP